MTILPRLNSSDSHRVKLQASMGVNLSLVECRRYSCLFHWAQGPMPPTHSTVIASRLFAANVSSYLKMVVNRNDGEAAAFYSSRFSIAGMTGAFPNSVSGQSSTEVQAAYKQVMADVAAVPQNQAILARKAQAPGAAAPAPVAPAAGPDAAAPPAAAPAGENQPYSMQTVGDIKYAPMQQQPPTSITAQGTAPLYPKTAYDLARAPMALPTFISTVTQPVTYKTSSIVNQVRTSAARRIYLPIRSSGNGRPCTGRRHGQVPRAVEGLTHGDVHLGTRISARIGR